MKQCKIKAHYSFRWVWFSLIWIAFPFAIAASYLLSVHYNSNPNVRFVFRSYNMVGMTGPEVERLLGDPVDTRTYYEKDGTPYYYWDYTKRRSDRIWLVRRHKVVFDKNGERVVKVLCYFSDDDDD